MHEVCYELSNHPMLGLGFVAASSPDALRHCARYIGIFIRIPISILVIHIHIYD